MKQLIKKIIKIIIKTITGSNENITFKFCLSALIASITFFILSSLYNDDPLAANIFMFFSVTFSGIWLTTAKGIITAYQCGFELIRLTGFLFTFYFLLTFFKNFSIYTGFGLYIRIILVCIALFPCCLYLVAKFCDILDFFKKTFASIKSKLYNSSDPPTSKTKAFIENITALLASIISLSVAVQTITNTIINIFYTFK